MLFVLAVAGCMSDDGSGIARGDLRKLVLQPDDLPAAFQRFDEGRQALADLPTGARSDPARFGRVEGWKARYRRVGSQQTRGALVVESRADLFESAGGAKDELEAHRAEIEDAVDGGTARLLEAPELGDEAFAATVRQQAAVTPVRFFLVAWREEDVSASVFVNGFEGKMRLEDALGLARKQQRRIAAAGS